MIETMNLSKILKRALKNGGDFAEIFEELSHNTHLQREGRRFEKIFSGADAGVGLRVVHGGKTAYAYSNEITEASLLGLADGLADAVRAGAFDRDIAMQKKDADWRQVVKIDPSQVGLAEKIKALQEADELAWGIDSRLVQVTTSYRDHLRHIRIANSFGELCEDRQVYLVFVVQAVASDGKNLQTGYEPLGGTQGFETLSDGAAIETA